MAQITGDDSQAQPPFHPVLPVVAAFAPAIIASQTRNAPLDARAPAIPTPPGARVFQRFTFLGELAGGRDRHSLDASFLELGLRLGRVDAAVPSPGARRLV